MEKSREELAILTGIIDNLEIPDFQKEFIKEQLKETIKAATDKAVDEGYNLGSQLAYRRGHADCFRDLMAVGQN